MAGGEYVIVAVGRLLVTEGSRVGRIAGFVGVLEEGSPVAGAGSSEDMVQPTVKAARISNETIGVIGCQ
jgi:hypothetical protein